MGKPKGGRGSLRGSARPFGRVRVVRSYFKFMRLALVHKVSTAPLPGVGEMGGPGEGAGAELRV